MFTDFFYLIRSTGLSVSPDEWLCLMEALDEGLAGNSLTEFYYLCRSILIKSESDYDRFDMAFAEYFKGVETETGLPPELLKWLEEGSAAGEPSDMPLSAKEYGFEELMSMFRQRLSEQKERHDGGSYWIGTGGTSPMGHGGYNPSGIRVEGESRHKSAVQVAGERNFQDFRSDLSLDTRQFQMALRRLRRFSSRTEAERTELDIDGTIDATCSNAGLLKLVYEKPRKNTVKLLLLMDSGGSMTSYSRLCSRLFQAAHQSTHLKDLKIYYFHNCVYDYLYTSPSCRSGQSVETERVFHNLDSEYRVIFVGDAAMSAYELTARGGNIEWSVYNEEPGIIWLHKFKERYSRCIWLNPIPEDRWERAYGAYTIKMVRNIFPMYPLSLDGLDRGIGKLMTG